MVFFLVSGCVEKTKETVEQTSPISGGIEEVVDGVEEEDEEAEDGEDGIRVDGIPGKGSIWKTSQMQLFQEFALSGLLLLN